MNDAGSLRLKDHSPADPEIGHERTSAPLGLYILVISSNRFSCELDTRVTGTDIFFPRAFVAVHHDDRER